MRALLFVPLLFLLTACTGSQQLPPGLRGTFSAGVTGQLDPQDPNSRYNAGTSFGFGK